LVNSSRALLFPEAGQAAETASRWEAAVDEALDRATEELTSAVSL
jgi:hypothetical protein